MSYEISILSHVSEIARIARESSNARVPAVEKGTALVITRYRTEKAVILHPEDFDRLSSLDHDIAEIAEGRPEIGELAAKAHALEDSAGAPLEDPAEIRAMLGL
jgi:hypothetical protein